MKPSFEGWPKVAKLLREKAASPEDAVGGTGAPLKPGQRDSLKAIAHRLPQNGVLIADEVGMGKTRIAAEVTSAVVQAQGRVAIVIPSGLSFQWQDELRDGGVPNAPKTIRSMAGFLQAWQKQEESEQRTPWVNQEVVLLSHSFSSWRIRANGESWRWHLVPSLFAQWRKVRGRKLPKNFKEVDGKYSHISEAARSIATSAAKSPRARQLLDAMIKEVPWPQPLDHLRYQNDGTLRSRLQQCVGIGLGAFDLVIVDEAHKSRKPNSSLSTILEKILLANPEARRLTLTATPIELRPDQWKSTFTRLGVADTSTIEDRVSKYLAAVKKLKGTWRTDGENRRKFASAAKKYQIALAPFLLRRTKNEEGSIQKFAQHSGLAYAEYRRERDLKISPKDCPIAWRKAICAAEALSHLNRRAVSSEAKRLRLTMANGHGLSAVLSHTAFDEEKDADKEAPDDEGGSQQQPKAPVTAGASRRADWWVRVLENAFPNPEEALFENPTIKATVERIETLTQTGEKVLIFGRFTKPMQALVDLLNARELLRRVTDGRPWPQAGIHRDHAGQGELSALRIAIRQLNSPLTISKVNERLKHSYNKRRRQRDNFRRHLLENIERGSQKFPVRIRRLFQAFKDSVGDKRLRKKEDAQSVAFVSRAMFELMGVDENKHMANDPSDYAAAFQQLMEAAADRELLATAEDVEADDDELSSMWSEIEGTIDDEYNRPQGGFARLMYGGTKPETRRMIQVAFNRRESFPRVLVAQSLVGREGLNLHKACRHVVLLHPEWNPGNVEQQIGRVDRVGSRWAEMLEHDVALGKAGPELPRIEIHAVICEGTYDEHNWKVLRERWNELRLQLKGEVILEKVTDGDEAAKAALQEIGEAVPRFSPHRRPEPAGQAVSSDYIAISAAKAWPPNIPTHGTATPTNLAKTSD